MIETPSIVRFLAFVTFVIVASLGHDGRASAQTYWKGDTSPQAKAAFAAAAKKDADTKAYRRQEELEEKREEYRSYARRLADEVAALPVRRKEAAAELQRCINILSAIDCGNARVAAYEDYEADRSLRNNLGLCVDRASMAVAIVYQAKLINNGILRSQYDEALLDQTLGEIIDNCPDRAGAALKMRRELHNT